uniref:CTD small phosphatase-like protein 2 isoform X2 n=1 Tax=Geotrypetes seraphini TaxID=260995 RepID=A0A6P8S394_GEOSA|nr:CTD small phosphatase-like protein 2 isoform X2 [Geotrypetes seraphini]
MPQSKSITMILRSRKIIGQPPCTPRKDPAGLQTPRSEGWQEKADPSDVSSSSATMSSESNSLALLTPRKKKKNGRAAKMRQKRRQMVQAKVYAVTPMRERSLRVHFQLDKSDPLDNAFSPGISFSPRVGEIDCCSSPLQKERKKSLELPYFADLPSDEAEELFNPYKFLSNIPQLSGINRSRKKEIPFKMRSAPICTLVLELEDTLMHCSLAPLTHFDFSFLIPFQDVYYKVYLNLRPFCREFLETISKMYEIFVFTTAKQEYGENIMDFLDPQKKLIRHRLFQEDCICIQGHYVKDLSVLNRELATTVAVDPAPHTFPYHISNRIPIQSWLGNKEDTELLKLIPLLERLAQIDDVRREISRKFRLNKLIAEY